MTQAPERLLDDRDKGNKILGEFRGILREFRRRAARR
jgi:hypothetical protein